MLHGPCGKFRPNSTCMKNDHNRCSKFYPKDYNPETYIKAEDGMPQYRRRDDNKSITKLVYKFTNRDVVPYNPYLLLKYNAHINLELCACDKVVKYLYKYVYKGHDRATLRIFDEKNEISQYINTRYTGANEAFWRLSQYDMQHKSHFVQRLKVHLPGENEITFTPDGEAEAVANNSEKKSKLEAWFILNREDPEARQYTYCEVGEKYVFNEEKRKWTRRKVKMFTLIMICRIIKN